MLRMPAQQYFSCFDKHWPISFEIESADCKKHNRIYLQSSLQNCMHGYDRVRNVHVNSVTHARKSVHGIDSTV